MKCFVVAYECGEYSDYSMEIEHVFSTRKGAEKFTIEKIGLENWAYRRIKPLFEEKLTRYECEINDKKEYKQLRKRRVLKYMDKWLIDNENDAVFKYGFTANDFINYRDIPNYNIQEVNFD